MDIDAKLKARAKRSMYSSRNDDAEQLTYHPSGGDARQIYCLVERLQSEQLQGARAAVIRVSVLNDATDGIGMTELNVGSDQIDVPERVGESAATRNITRLVAQDAVELTLEVR